MNSAELRGAIRAARAEQARRLRLFASVPQQEPPVFCADGLRLTRLDAALLDLVDGGAEAEYCLEQLWPAPRSRRGQRRLAARLRSAVARLNRRIAVTGFAVVRQGVQLRLVHGERTAVARCVEALRWYLASGPRPVGDLAILLGRRFSAATIKRARRQAGVEAFRVGGWGGRWFVRLADSAWRG